MIAFNRFFLVIFVAASLQQITTADRCPSSWISWGHHCYRFELDKMESWKDAEARCLALGSDGRHSHLASIHSKEEQNFIYEVYRLAVRKDVKDAWSPLLWIGLEVGSTQAKLSWADDSCVDYVNWYTGEQNNKPNTGVEISNGIGKNGGWADAPDPNRRNHYVCKMPQ